MTIRTWVRPSRFLEESCNIPRKGHIKPTCNYGLHLLPDGRVAAKIDGLSPRYLTSSDPIEVNKWTYISMRWSKVAGHFDLYIGGKKVGGEATTGTPVTNDMALVLGSTSSTRVFIGLLKGVEIHNQALSDDAMEKCPCPVPSSPDNLDFSGCVGKATPETCSVVCQVGYTFSSASNNIVTCQADGTWTRPLVCTTMAPAISTTPEGDAKEDPEAPNKAEGAARSSTNHRSCGVGWRHRDPHPGLLELQDPCGRWGEQAVHSCFCGRW